MASTINATSAGLVETADTSAALTLQTAGTDALVLSAGKVVNPSVTNYTETTYTANSSTAITLALTNGTVQIVTLTANATITMPTAAAGKSFLLILRQDATGNRSVTWTTVNWAGASAPTITGTASKQDIYSFFSDGTSWYGVTVGQNYTQ
jgi:FtsP/CotA-like multicopper oxidase with cupredoxin domain